MGDPATEATLAMVAQKVPRLAGTDLR